MEEKIIPLVQRRSLLKEKTVPLAWRRDLMEEKTIPRVQRRGLLDKKIIPLAQRKGLLKEKTVPRVQRRGLFLPEFDPVVRQIVGRSPRRVVGNGEKGGGVEGFGRRIREIVWREKRSDLRSETTRRAM